MSAFKHMYNYPPHRRLFKKKMLTIDETIQNVRICASQKKNEFISIDPGVEIKKEAKLVLKQV